MKNRLANVAALLVLAALSVGYGLAQDADPAQPDEKPKRKKGQGKGKRGPKARTDQGEAGNKPGAFAGDLDALKADLELTEQQEKKILALRKKRDAALAKWDETHEKRKAQVEEKLPSLMGKDDARMREQAEAYLRSLKVARARVAAPYDKQMFGVLTREQRGKWNAPILQEAVMKEFDSPILGGEQEDKLRALCEKMGASQSAPVSPETHPSLLISLYKQAYQQVLSTNQRKEYARVKMEELARKREEEAKKKAANKKKKKKKK